VPGQDCPVVEKGDEPMKLRRLVMTSVLVLLALTMVVVPVSADGRHPFEGKKTPVSGTGWMRYNPQLPPDDTPKSLGNGKSLYVGWSTNQYELSDPRLVGFDTMRSYCVADDVTLKGQCWGTVELVTSGGSWHGTIAGKLEWPLLVLHYSLTGEGAYKGLSAKFDSIVEQTGTYDIPNKITGYIVEKGSNRDRD
jgi:hypothetical protein